MEHLEHRRLLAVLTVNGSGGADFATISDAILAANSNDQIEVSPAVYNEDLVVDLTVTLSGPQRGVDARPSSGSTRLPQDEAIIRGSILLEAQNVVFGGFRVEAAAVGVETSELFSGYRILNNVVASNAIGVRLESDGLAPSIVTENYFVDNNLVESVTGYGPGLEILRRVSAARLRCGRRRLFRGSVASRCVGNSRRGGVSGVERVR